MSFFTLRLVNSLKKCNLQKRNKNAVNQPQKHYAMRAINILSKKNYDKSGCALVYITCLCHLIKFRLYNDDDDGAAQKQCQEPSTLE